MRVIEPSRCLMPVILAALLVASLTGCCTYKHQSFWEVTKMKAELESNNFVVRKLGVQGTESCPFLFGIGGNLSFPVSGIPLGDPRLLKNAMMDFHRKADLKDKPAFLHNINVEWTKRGVPCFFLVRRVTITADVVEFTDEYLDYKSKL